VNDRELEVLQLRFGGRRRTQSRQRVAQVLGASVQAIWRIERRALRKLRLSALGH
jgi:DNA-directed RNA polymerase sigma subunit (sigma70/sigma32)